MVHNQNRFERFTYHTSGFAGGTVISSDCRFTLEWIMPHVSDEHVALNYCTTDGEYSKKDHLWHLDLQDHLQGRETSIRAKAIVNCAGIWSDEVNRQFEIDSPFKHALSKGVYLSIKRPADHDSLMIFEMGDHSDVLTLVPWGPVSLWGPTETFPQNIEDGLVAHPEDIQFLLERMNHHLKTPVEKSQIVSIRCGIRPLAVKKDYCQDCYPLDLSRRQQIVSDRTVPWISSYGGKLTGCQEMALKISKHIEKYCPEPRRQESIMESETVTNVEWASWPGLNQKIPSPQWCAEHELCCTLDDYLRRRTNLSQWIPRQGLGSADEYISSLLQAAQSIYRCDHEDAVQKVEDYRQYVENNFDELIDRV